MRGSILIKTNLAGAAWLVCVAALAASPALALKSRDTFRVAFLEATQNADPYTDPKPEINFLGSVLYDTLIEFDGPSGRFEPLLATSWKQINPTASASCAAISSPPEIKEEDSNGHPATRKA